MPFVHIIPETLSPAAQNRQSFGAVAVVADAVVAYASALTTMQFVVPGQITRAVCTAANAAVTA
ncbi:hypothetical protein B1987_24420 [Mycobacterium kansasii]|uniref:Uncharacterized protein n=1 Tax=Mycobacterium attenuatum TaxID=2341086 RepID=A0A498PYE9_9MYCO|nr:hypothetical protein [Mycobacterium attenuatum]ORB86400.1 hypothetical protein B1987_24420 [Mycobacterium kansasii]VBA37273.1 hypothetical protein LAUMK136_01845 [Mycobacterium attenuatum]VBA50265.1 hypothetical protein LAUMK191_01837 [Mycobacterium attenuatum]VBA55968.1 hypothetical protein LAUMK41_01911 [Mycobacterium attenuatum]